MTKVVMSGIISFVRSKNMVAAALVNMRKCRNWQTSKTKDLVVVTLCGFKSHLPQWLRKQKALIYKLPAFLLS